MDISQWLFILEILCFFQLTDTKHQIMLFQIRWVIILFDYPCHGSRYVDLPNVEVYPWPSREDFARAFVNMDPYDDAIRRAQRQLSGESLAFAAARLDVDGSLAYGSVQSQYQTQLYTNNQLPANNLLNPYAWSKLIKDWKEGKLSKQ